MSDVKELMQLQLTPVKVSLLDMSNLGAYLELIDPGVKKVFCQTLLLIKKSDLKDCITAHHRLYELMTSIITSELSLEFLADWCSKPSLDTEQCSYLYLWVRNTTNGHIDSIQIPALKRVDGIITATWLIDPDNGMYDD